MRVTRWMGSCFKLGKFPATERRQFSQHSKKIRFFLLSYVRVTVLSSFNRLLFTYSKIFKRFFYTYGKSSVIENIHESIFIVKCLILDIYIKQITNPNHNKSPIRQIYPYMYPYISVYI